MVRRTSDASLHPRPVIVRRSTVVSVKEHGLGNKTRGSSVDRLNPRETDVRPASTRASSGPLSSKLQSSKPPTIDDLEWFIGLGSETTIQSQHNQPLPNTLSSPWLERIAQNRPSPATWWCTSGALLPISSSERSDREVLGTYPRKGPSSLSLPLTTTRSAIRANPLGKKRSRAMTSHPVP